ncbi:MAG: phage tail length tape measure family protein [Rhodobacteraceae bacterium]|nr:phage tail length tape measure family protein [Paracoccaceae bacterium]
MTQLTLSMLLRAEGAPAAKAAIQDVATSTDRLGTATTRGATADRAAATAKQANAQAAQRLTAANRQAAGATGNLIAQFNDIGMMMAAGQNPLQLAVQQGAQITQVIGPMGAAGAASALGSAFMGLLNPLSLVTLGVIYAGAEMIQWLSGAAEGALTLEQRVEAVNDAIDRWRDSSGQSFDELQERFGALTPEVVALQREITQLRLADILTAADEAARKLSGTLGDGVLASAGGDLRRLLLDNGTVIGTAAGNELRAMFDAVGEATGIQDQLQAVEALGARFVEVTGGIQAMSAEQRTFYSTILDAESALRAAAAATGDVSAETERASAAANQLALRASAVASAIASADGSNLVAAFQAAFPVASQLLGVAQGIIATIDAARAAAAAQESLDQMAIEFSPGGQANLKYGGRTPGGTASQKALEARNRPARLPGGAAGSGGGAAARDEANALQELIASLEDEIEALRIQDPIQRELLKHREALAGATEAEKQKVEELIAVREREAAALEGAKARREFFEDLGNNALEALIFKGEEFNDVLKNIGQSLIQAGIQAALFGSGPFGNIFGGTSIMTQLFPGLAAKAEGGMVNGPGTGTSDSILTRLSNGEFVVNAKATARNRHLLEAINAGSLPGYATGGMVGGDNRRTAGRNMGGGPSTLVVDVRGAQGNTEIQEMVRRGVQTGLQLYDREALPRSVQRVSADQKRVN